MLSGAFRASCPSRLGVAHNSSLEELRSLLEVASREAQQPQLGEPGEETPETKKTKKRKKKE